MDVSSRYYCSKCYAVYDELIHKPRIIQKCLHSFCEQCLQSMIENFKLICPEDQGVIERIRSVEDFPLNYELLRFIRQNKNPKLNIPTLHVNTNPTSSQIDNNESASSTASLKSSHLFDTTFRFNNEDRNLKIKEICPIHKNKFQFYCHEHNQSLCVTCVQSKEHINHKIIDIHELNKKIADSQQRIENIHTQIKDEHYFYENEQKVLLKDTNLILQNRQREVILLIEQKFQDLVQKLRNLEELAIRQVGIMVLKIEDYVRETVSNSQKDVCFQITEFHRRLDQTLIEPSIQILVEQETSLNIQGQLIISKIQSFLKDGRHLISSAITENLTVSFNKHQLDNFCLIPLIMKFQNNSPLQDSQSKVNPNTSSTKQKSSISSNFFSYSKASQQHPPQTIDIDRIIKTEGDDIPSPQFTFSDYKSQRIKIPVRQAPQISTPRSRSIESRVIERIKLQLMNNNVQDKLDMSNQDLNDHDIIQICEWLQKSKSNIEIIKLAKNKISDYGFVTILKCLQQKKNIHTLNLTSNQCTSKTLEIMDQFAKKGQLHIKNIYLTNCKINAIKHKEQQNTFQKQGINLYL